MRLKAGDQPLICSSILAIVVHSLFLFTTPAMKNGDTAPIEQKRLTVEFLSDTETFEEVQTTELKDLDTQIIKQAKAADPQVPRINDEPENTDSITLYSDLKTWAEQDAKEHGEQSKKTDLSSPRTDSYSERWLDPDRIDTRSSDRDTKISVPEGTIWIKKVEGKLICSTVSHDGEVSSFNCGDPERNRFLDDNGKIKNSDRNEW